MFAIVSNLYYYVKIEFLPPDISAFAECSGQEGKLKDYHK